jgi:putative MATE family efflux protein
MPQPFPPQRQDLTEGPIAAAIWSLTLPMMLGNIARTTFSLVDTYFVGRLGAAALTAVGVSGQILMLLSTVFMGIATASTAMVARAVGAKDQERANHVAGQSLTLTFMIAAVLTAAGYALSSDMLRLLDVTEDVVALGTGYLQVSFLGMLAALAMFMTAGILRGAGDAKTPLIIGLGAMLLNIVLDPVLIFGLCGLPELGVNGAALASVIAQVLAFVAGLVVLMGGKFGVRVTARSLIPNAATLWRMIAIGVPNTVQMSLRFLMGLVLAKIVAPFGTAVVAAFTVGNRLQMLGFMPTFALGDASATLVGQNLGAGKPERAQRSVLISVAIAVSIMAAAAACLFFLGRPLTRVFSRDAAVIEAGATFLRISAIGYIFAGVSIVLSRSITGAGDTVPPMFINLFALWGLQVPLAYWLSHFPRLAETGVWWAGVIASLTLALLAAAYFYSGRWKRIRI